MLIDIYKHSHALNVVFTTKTYNSMINDVNVTPYARNANQTLQHFKATFTKFFDDFLLISVLPF